MEGTIFDVKNSIPVVRGSRGGLMVDPADKASLLSSQFDSKQCREQLVTPMSCIPPSICAILWLSELLPSCVCFLILICMGESIILLQLLPLFLKKAVDIIAPKLTIIFRRLTRLLSFPECWLSANITAIPKGAPSPHKENYWPVSITPILSKVYEKLGSHKLSSFCKKYGSLPAAQVAYRKGLGCTFFLKGEFY